MSSSDRLRRMLGQTRRPPRRALALLLAAALAAGCEPGAVGGGRGALTGTVVKIIDGDTIRVQLGDRREKVRYIGIDTPESVKPGTRVQCFAKRAAAANAALVAGRRVRLVSDVDERDRYRRRLAYVYVGDRFINEILVRDGYARTLTIAPNVRFAARFGRLQRAAREARRGLWRACA